TLKHKVAGTFRFAVPRFLMLDKVTISITSGILDNSLFARRSVCDFEAPQAIWQGHSLTIP
ncbi:MAG: hypothetical protein ACKO9Q_04160, partial [Pirellula sp.]